MTDNTVLLVIFALTYAGLAIGRIPGLKLDRTGIAMLGAIATMVFGGKSTGEIIGYIHWPTVLLLFGFFVLSAQLRLSGFFDRLASQLAGRLDHPVRFLFSLMLATASLSAFLNHDIVCLAFAPVVATAMLRRSLNPVPYMVALAISSNIGAAATLVGNPQDMLIGQVAGLGFGHYALWSLVPVLFALMAAFGLIWLLSRNHLALAGTTTVVPPGPAFSYDRAHTIKGLVILALVIGLFFTPLPMELVALTAAAIHLASRKFQTEELLRWVDWPILVLFMSLFVVTGAFETTGYGEQAVGWLGRASIHLDSLPTLAVVTAGLSNLVNNSAAVILLLKVGDVAHAPAAYVLALANSFGGSLIIVGSVSNIIVVQQARAIGVDISFREYARLGVPVTLTALAGLIGWVWLVT